MAALKRPNGAAARAMSNFGFFDLRLVNPYDVAFQEAVSAVGGPGNPLGTRWIGTSAPAIGIHGTPVPSSIGTRASHGCIRMYIPDVERLYRQVEIGTRVYIR